jgi:hypothetical protein
MHVPGYGIIATNFAVNFDTNAYKGTNKGTNRKYTPGNCDLGDPKEIKNFACWRTVFMCV